MRNSLTRRAIGNTEDSDAKHNDRTVKSDPGKFLSDNLVRIYYRIINKNIQSPAPYDSNKRPVLTSVMSFFSNDSKENHMIKACLKTYRQRLLIDLQHSSRAKANLQRVIDESQAVFEAQEQQLISWGMRDSVHLFKLQTWSRMTRSKLMKEMVEFVHERIELRAEKTGRYIKMYESKTNPDTYTVAQCQEFCAPPEFIFNRDNQFMRQANKLLRLDLICSSTGRKFKEKQTELVQLGPDDRSRRKEILRSIFERYKSLPTIEELVNIEEDLTWIQFCEWYARRAEEKQQIEDEFADFVEDQREREGRLFFKWRTSLILPGTLRSSQSSYDLNATTASFSGMAGTHGYPDTDPDTAASPSPSLGAMGMMSPVGSSSNDSFTTFNSAAPTPVSSPMSHSIQSPTPSAASSSATAAYSSPSPSSAGRAPASTGQEPGQRRQSSGSLNSSFSGLKMTPASIKAFIKYFANDLIGVTYQIPRDCMEANWELTSTLFHKKAGLMRYSSYDQRDKDQCWRYQSQLCRYLHPSVYYVPDEYHGDEPCSLSDVDSDDQDREYGNEKENNDNGSWREVVGAKCSFDAEEYVGWGGDKAKAVNIALREAEETLQDEGKAEDATVEKLDEGRSVVNSVGGIESFTDSGNSSSSNSTWRVNDNDGDSGLSSDTPNLRPSSVSPPHARQGLRQGEAGSRREQTDSYAVGDAVEDASGETTEYREYAEAEAEGKQQQSDSQEASAEVYSSASVSMLSGLISDDLILPDYCTPQTSVDHSASHSASSLLSANSVTATTEKEGLVFQFGCESGSGSSDHYTGGGLNFDGIYNAKEERGEGGRNSPNSSPVRRRVTHYTSSPSSSSWSSHPYPVPSAHLPVTYTLSSRLQNLPLYSTGQYGKDYARASRMLSLVATSMTPQDILFNLTLAFKWLLRDAIDISGSRSVIGADLLVPLFTMVLINAQVPNIHMVLQHVKDYGNFESHGDVSYNVANLEGSLSFLMDYEVPLRLRKQFERDEPWADVLCPSPSKPDPIESRAAVVSIDLAHDGGTIKEALAAEPIEDGSAHGSVPERVEEGAGGGEALANGGGHDENATAGAAADVNDFDEQRTNDQLAMERLGAWLREQHTMEDTIDILQKEGWMI